MMLAAIAKTATITRGKTYDELGARLCTEYGKGIGAHIEVCYFLTSFLMKKGTRSNCESYERYRPHQGGSIDCCLRECCENWRFV